MASVAKYSQSACGIMCKHFARENENYSNEEINKELTELNYNLGPERQISDIEFIQERKEEVHCLNRDDVKVMCSWVVTKPKDLPREMEQEFFEKTYDFLSDRYGKENVISSYVHYDETTPHMHFAFVPVTYDERKDYEKISAKEVITRQELKCFHGELQNYLTENGIRCRVMNGATRAGNRTVRELKRNKSRRYERGHTFE